MLYATKQAIKDGLDCFEASGILKKVSYCECAAPIVVVPKKDRKTRICSDYKVTVNQALEVDQYPLPKPEDLFATLVGRTKFTALEFSITLRRVIETRDSKHASQSLLSL